MMIEQINKTSLGDGVETDAVGAVDRKARQQVQEDLAKVKIGPEALAGRRSDLAQAAWSNLYEDNKKKERNDFILKAASAQAYLDKLDLLIAEYDRKAKEYFERAEAKQKELDAHYALMEEADDLLNDYRQGKGDLNAARAYLEKREAKLPNDADEVTVFALLTEKLRQDRFTEDGLQKHIDWLKEMGAKNAESAKALKASKEDIRNAVENGEDLDRVQCNIDTKIRSLQNEMKELEEKDPSAVKEYEDLAKEQILESAPQQNQSSNSAAFDF